MIASTSPTHPNVSTNPPIDSEVPVVGYLVDYGFGPIANVNADRFQVKVFISDLRKHPDGTNYENQLFVLKDSLYPTLPDAYQFADGTIRFFAYESQLPAVLAVLASGLKVWMRTREGRVGLVTAAAKLPSLD